MAITDENKQEIIKALQTAVADGDTVSYLEVPTSRNRQRFYKVTLLTPHGLQNVRNLNADTAALLDLPTDEHGAIVTHMPGVDLVKLLAYAVYDNTAALTAECINPDPKGL